MYHGRSARTLYTRQSEHISGCVAKRTDNALFKHTQLFHEGVMPEFEFQAERFFSDATSAQIFEGVSINNTPSDEGYLMRRSSKSSGCERFGRVIVQQDQGGCMEVLPWGGAREREYPLE